jgi:hypothetical protein
MTPQPEEPTMKPASTLAVIFMTAVSALALETPLVMEAQGEAGLTAVVEPAAGTMTIYSVEGQTLTRYGSANFVSDMQQLRGLYRAQQEKNLFSALRIGSTNFKPAAADFLNAFPNKPTDLEKANNLESLQARAWKAEHEFWALPKPYDGVVRGAFGRGAVMLVIPCVHAVMFYECTDRTRPTLKAWRNYGPELMVPQAWESTPLPENLVKMLPEDIQQQFTKSLAERLKNAGQKGGALTLAESDPWVCATSNDRFLMVDANNKHVVTYEWGGGNAKLVGSRNMEVDMMIPTGASTQPSATRAFADFGIRYKNLLVEYQFPLDMDNLIAFVQVVTAKRTNTAKVSPLQAISTAGDVILNFVDQRKLFVYRVMGQGNKLEFVAMRDYTIDVGLSLLADRLMANKRGHDALQEVISQVKNEEIAFLTLKYALSEAPALVEKVENDSKLKPLHKNIDWQATIDDAKKRAAEEVAERNERIKKVEEMRAKRTKPANGG